MPILTLSRPDARSVRARAFVFEDAKSQVLLSAIEQLAPSDTTVLLYGEAGTGKEIIARHLHELGPRAARPFVALCCGALNEALIESELFGHEPGVLSDAIAGKAGAFEAANGGTLFLDELTELSPWAQTRLLRVLETSEVERLGARQPVPVDVRLIVANDGALEQAVAAGHFREDLYYALDAASLSLHPLRERADDILPLAIHFLDVYRQQLGIEAATLTADAIESLIAHAWPGNIRELETVVHRALRTCRDRRITARDLDLASQPAHGSPRPCAEGAAL